MKATVIIVISVVASVAAVLGILFADELYAAYVFDQYLEMSDKLNVEFEESMSSAARCGMAATTPWKIECFDKVLDSWHDTVKAQTEKYGFTEETETLYESVLPQLEFEFACNNPNSQYYRGC